MKETGKLTAMEPIKLFYCYVPQDKKLRDELEKHLIMLKRLGQITLRLNREVLAGTNWSQKEDRGFQSADLILLLISPDFMASDYHYGIEMRHALEKHEAGNVWVIPIILRPTPLWERSPIGKLQALPEDGRAITERRNRDAAFTEVVKGISEVVALLFARKRELAYTTKADEEKFPKFTQVIGPLCATCGARNPLGVITCENCGDLLLTIAPKISQEVPPPHPSSSDVAEMPIFSHPATPDLIDKLQSPTKTSEEEVLTFAEISTSLAESSNHPTKRSVGQSVELYCDNCGAANALTARYCQYCTAPLPFNHTTGILPEQILLNGRYQLERRIGQGGMGAVYKAIDTSFNNRYVALKEMSRAGLTPTGFQVAEEAFHREANLLAGLLHRNLPRIYDHFTENERSYLVMDFIEGQTLEEYLERRGSGPLPVEQVLEWGEELCEVLSYLHSQQPPVIFRDLKPSNVMIDKGGYIFLIDFGIARLFKPGQSYDTVAFGSPGYAAPEQYGKAQSSPRSDIYSLGALLHCLLTGVDPSERPFAFRSASQLNPEVPPDLEDLLEQMLEMNAERRPASIQEVLNTLRLLYRQRLSGIRPQTSSKYAATQASQSAHLEQVAHTLYTQGRVREALVAYDQVVQADSTYALGWQGRGLTQALAGQHQEALVSFEKALELDKSLVTSWNGKGAALSNLQRYQSALEAFDKALLIAPGNALAYNGKGVALSELGQLEEALNAFGLALDIDPRMALAWNNKGLVLRRMERYAEALSAFDQALTLDPNVVVYWNGKGLALYDMGRSREALQAFQEATRKNANYAPAWLGIGNVHYAQRNLEEALEAYERAIRYDPKFVKALDRRGKVLSDMGRYANAIVSYDQALGIDSRYAPAWQGKADTLCELGRYREALDAYERALLIDPDLPLVWNGQGNAFYYLGQFERALEAYEHAIQLNARILSAWYNKSLVFKQLGRYQDALDAAEEAIRLAPNDPDNWLRKVEALKKLPRRREERLGAEKELARLRKQEFAHSWDKKLE
jgi:tetratricopeptide (TPR) repeat protein/ribosomal protein L40E